MTDLHDDLAERAVLGGMLLSRDAITECTSILTGTDFYHPRHQVIFETVVGMFAAGTAADALTVADELTKAGALGKAGGQAYLHEVIADTPSAANAPYYAEIVRDKARLRAVVAAGTRIVASAQAEGADPGDVESAAQAAMMDLTRGRDAGAVQALSETLDPTLDAIDAANSGPRPGVVPFGFEDLDSLTGGMHPGNLVIVAARPATGKSVFAADVCRFNTMHVDTPRKVLTFHLEMSSEQAVTRIVAAEAKVNLGLLTKGGMGERDWARVAGCVDRLSAAPLFIDSTPEQTVATIAAKCRRQQAETGLHLVVVDYLQLLSSAGRVESRQAEVSEFSRRFKLLAKDLAVPVIVVAQLNRKSEERHDRRPQMSDLRESGSLEQDADMVLLLHRDRDDPEKAGEGEVIVAKNRMGEAGVVRLAWQGHYSRFASMAMEDF